MKSKYFVLLFTILFSLSTFGMQKEKQKASQINPIFSQLPDELISLIAYQKAKMGLQPGDLPLLQFLPKNILPRLIVPTAKALAQGVTQEKFNFNSGLAQVPKQIRKEVVQCLPLIVGFKKPILCKAPIIGKREFCFDTINPIVTVTKDKLITRTDDNHWDQLAFYNFNGDLLYTVPFEQRNRFDACVYKDLLFVLAFNENVINVYSLTTNEATQLEPITFKQNIEVQYIINNIEVQYIINNKDGSLLITTLNFNTDSCKAYYYNIETKSLKCVGDIPNRKFIPLYMQNKVVTSYKNKITIWDNKNYTKTELTGINPKKLTDTTIWYKAGKKVIIYDVKNLKQIKEIDTPESVLQVFLEKDTLILICKDYCKIMYSDGKEESIRILPRDRIRVNNNKLILIASNNIYISSLDTLKLSTVLPNVTLKEVTGNSLLIFNNQERHLQLYNLNSGKTITFDNNASIAVKGDFIVSRLYVNEGKLLEICIYDFDGNMLSKTKVPKFYFLSPDYKIKKECPRILTKNNDNNEILMFNFPATLTEVIKAIQEKATQK